MGPLRSGESKECYFDETTTASAIGQKTQKLIEFVDKRANGVLDGASLADLSIDGMVNVVALRNTSFKNQRCGIYSIRLKEIASVSIASALKAQWLPTLVYII